MWEMTGGLCGSLKGRKTGMSGKSLEKKEVTPDGVRQIGGMNSSPEKIFRKK